MDISAYLDSSQAVRCELALARTPFPIPPRMITLDNLTLFGECLGFRVQGFGFRVQALGFRVQGLGLWTKPCTLSLLWALGRPDSPPQDVSIADLTHQLFHFRGRMGIGFRVSGLGLRA